MRTLTLDIETKSGVELSKVGVHKYCEDPDFDILVLAYRWDDWQEDKVEVVDVYHDGMSESHINALASTGILKTAFNAQFERVCISEWLRRKAPEAIHGVRGERYLNPAVWRCDMVAAAAAGVSGSLDQVAKTLKVERQKDPIGKKLIKMFSTPPFADPDEYPEEWEQFKRYCGDDVLAESAVAKAIEPWPLPEAEWKLYALDQQINDRGIKIDAELCKAATEMMGSHKEDSMEQLKQLTGLDNPNSIAQLKAWVAKKGVQVDSLGKEIAQELIDDESTPEEVREVLTLRLGAGQSSTSKYQTALDMMCADGRIRGQFQFYGASTGRWAGRGMQLQNLPRNFIEPLEDIRSLAKTGDAEMLEVVTGSVGDTIKQLIRTALIPEAGKMFFVSDFSAIEARVLAWYANESWVLEVFRGDGKIYEATAAKMLHKSIDEVTKDDRQKGKVATLALGYQGAVGSLISMGAIKMGIAEEELPGIVSQWRNANKGIVNFWSIVEKSAKAAIDGKTVTLYKDPRKLVFRRRSGALVITLPSGRELVYQKAYIDENGRIVFRTTKKRDHTYGGKLAENIVQATARDLLAHGMQNLTVNKWKIVAHIHDEAVVETEGVHPDTAMRAINSLLCDTPEWAQGLPLNAEGYHTNFYKKD